MGLNLRVLVTGSRDWPESHAEVLYDDLDALLKDDTVSVLTVVHGDCPSGIDLYASRWCREESAVAVYLGKDVIEERHESAWNTLGEDARARRDELMVARGADICLAYPIDFAARASGTRECMAKAAAAGIQVWERSLETNRPVA